MENNDTQEPVKNTGKMSKADNIAATIRSIIPKSPKGIYMLCDIFVKEIRDKHGSADLERAMYAWMFDDCTESKKFIDDVSRRKFRCNPAKNLDFAQFDHFLSYLLEKLSEIILINPKITYRPVIMEHLPEILALFTPIEIYDINMKFMQLNYGRNARKKAIVRTESATKEELPSNGIVEVEEIKTPIIISPNEPELELKIIPEPVDITVPEIISDAKLNLQDPIANSPILPENIPEPMTDPIIASYVESQKTYKQKVNLSAL